MADFRKWLPALAIVALLISAAVPASAQFQALTCTANAGVPPVIRAEGLTELVGDLVLNCTGGNPAIGAFPVNWQIFLNTNITSRLQGTSSSLTESLLMIDEPLVPRPDGSAAPPLVLGTNVFRGSLNGANSLQWLGIPFTAPGSVTRVIRITNVRAAALPLSSTLVPTQIVAYISATASQSIPINNPQQTVGFVQTGMLFNVRNCLNDATLAAGDDGFTFRQCTASNADQAGNALNNAGNGRFQVRFQENFATAFKTRLTAGQVPCSLGQTSGCDATGLNGSIPGEVHGNSESGFVRVNELGGETGIAESGTRLMARFTNVPAGVQIFVSLTETASSSGGIDAQLIFTDQNGSSGGICQAINQSCSFPIQPINRADRQASCTFGCEGSVAGTCGQLFDIAQVPIVNGTGIAVWEIINANPSAQENALFAVLVSYTSNTASNLPGLGGLSVTGNLAPVSTNDRAATGPIPRFRESNIQRTGPAITACVTNLLFPFVSSRGGFDTGVAIVNTSDSPWTADFPVQTGTCKVNYYGTRTGGATAPAAFTTNAAVTSAEPFIFTLFGGGNYGMDDRARDGFTGYLIAQCNFLYGHGFAFISDLGAQRVAEGYLALVLDLPGEVRTNNFGESLGN